MSETPLNSYPQPEWNKADTISIALACVSRASDKKSSGDAYNELLYAIGNSHAGTYFPVVLAVVPALGNILRNGNWWARHCAVEVLIELAGSFVPDSGYEFYNGQPMPKLLAAEILKLVPLITSLEKHEGEVRPNVVELLDSLNQKRRQP